MKFRTPAMTLAFRPAHHARQRGLTLIELMVAMAIGLVVMATMLKVYVDSSRLYRFSVGLSRIQENGRFGLEFMRQDARLAGFWGCYHDITLSNGIKDGTANDRDYTSSDKGNDIGGTDGGGTLPDTIIFRGATGAAIDLSADAAADQPVPVTSTVGIATPATALISNCEVGDIFQVTAIAGNTLTHTTANNNSDSLTNAHTQGESSVYLVNEHEYCIGLGADLTTPVLRRLTFPNNLGTGARCAANGDEMIEGVENMQILYGEDTDADDVANRYVAGTEGPAMENVVSVRISLLLRSVNNNLLTDPTQVTYNGANFPNPLPANDRYLRKVFNATVSLRNGG